MQVPLRCALWVLLLGGAGLAAASSGRPTAPRDEGRETQPGVRLTKLQPLFRKDMPINGRSTVSLELPDGGEKGEMNVGLRKTRYDCAARIMGTTGSAEFSEQLDCYELIADGPFVWASWRLSSSPRGNFQLLKGPQGTPYLCWILAARLYLAEIRQPRDRAVALQDYILRERRSDTLCIPVGRLIPESAFWGVNALFIDMSVVSLDAHPLGLAVTIADPEGNRYTIVGQDGQWRVANKPYGQEPEPERENR